MGPFEMVVAIVFIVTVGSIIRARHGIVKDNKGNERFVGDSANAAETAALQAEIPMLKGVSRCSNALPPMAIGRPRSMPKLKSCAAPPTAAAGAPPATQGA